MMKSAAIKALAALAQESRLDAFRQLVQTGPEGLAAGELASRLGISPPALSFHLKALVHAGLASSRQDGRFVIYSADYDAMQALLGYLTDNCCGGQPCAPVRTADRARAPVRRR
jgi:DNA-binding transcriptional ArsR family regulator